MKKILAILSVAATFILAGCSPYTLVCSETYNNADLADYNTFRIVTPDQGALPKGMQMVTYYNIAAAIREQMVDRGFTEDASSPLLINIAVTVHREVATAPAYGPGSPVGPVFGPWGGFYPSFIWPRPYYWNPDARVITGIYKEGVLTMDMVDLDKREALYSVVGGRRWWDGSRGQYRNLEGISEAVDKLFSKFPVPLLPQYQHKGR